MLKLNHSLAALGLCVGTLSACVVDEGGDGTASDTDPTTSTTTSSTTDSTTTAGPTTDTGDTDPTGDTGETDTEGETGGVGGICLRACSDVVDCCEAYGFPAKNCLPEFIGELACEGGFCTFGDGCNADADCPGGAGGDTCLIEDGFGICSVSCSEDLDCEAIFPKVGYSCVDDICTPPDCEMDVDCDPAGTTGFTCDTATGNCIQCTDDTACAENLNGVSCNDGFCGCDGVSDCLVRTDQCGS